ncbi:MAG: MATE family efflux transporter, partial [Kiritimatiellae bacterium]|nr:MATE family efflux transporter [Kiritimatiellia bacterium]
RRNREVLTEGGLLKAIAVLAVPMLAGAVLQNVQSLIDLFWVGRLGSRAVAAVAMSGTILMVLFPMLMGLSTGTIALVSRSVGAGRPEDAAAAAGQSLMLAVVLGGITAACGWLFSPHLFRLLGAEPELIHDGSIYLRICLIGSFTVFILFIGNAALQGAGDAVTPMCIMAVSNVVNIILDPLLIFGPGPFPCLGIRGAASATVISQAAAAGLSLYILFTGKTHLRIHLKQWIPRAELSWRILRIGLPGSGQMLSRSLMSAVLMRIVASCGTAAVAAYGVGMRFHMIALMPAFALGGAAATMGGQNLGAGKPARARRAAWAAVGLDMVFMTGIAAVLMIFAPALIRFFNSEPDVVRTGTDYLRIVSPSYIFAALGIVFGRALNGAGDSMSPMIITVATLWGLQVPLAVMLSRIWEPATSGIWWAIVAAIIFQGLLAAWWFERGTWSRKTV